MGADVERPVVVGVDGSDNALQAVRWAAAEAERRQAPLRVVLAFDYSSDHVVGLPGLGEEFRERLLDQAQRSVDAAIAVAQQQAQGVQLEQQIEVGFPIGVLAVEARRAQLLVVGDRGMNRIEGLSLGSVAVALTAHAACPVVVVRGAELDGGASGDLPVVVGVDGSSTSEAALAFAFEAAAMRGVPLVAVRASWDQTMDPALVPLADWESIEAEEVQSLADKLAGPAAKFPDVAVERVVIRDRPARALLEQAGHAQLLVVGSRGRGEFAGLVLGSVSNAVVHRARCPVAVVRPG